jgi:hypothetical protein
MTRIMLVVAALAVVALLLFHNVESSALTRPGTVRVTSRALYSKPTSAGLLTVFAVYNRSYRQTPIGHAAQICAPIGGRGPLPAATRYCWATYTVGNNSIVIHGVSRSQTFYQIAIAGGTGIYRDVGGTLTVIRYARAPVREQLYFRLTP